MAYLIDLGASITLLLLVWICVAALTAIVAAGAAYVLAQVFFGLAWLLLWLDRHVFHRGRFPDGARWQRLGATESSW